MTTSPDTATVRRTAVATPPTRRVPGRADSPWVFALVGSAPAVVSCALAGLGVRASLWCVVVVAVGAVGPGRRLQQRWWLRMVFAVVAGVAVAAGTTLRVGAVATLGMLMADWMLLDRPPLPGLPRGSRLRAMWGHTAGVAVSRVLFTLLAVPAVLLPWLVARVAAVDPVGGSQGWSDAASSAGDPRRIWTRGRPLHTGAQRWRRAGVVVLAGLVLAGLVVTVGRSAATDPLDEVPAAFAGSAWYPDYVEDMNWIMHGRDYEPLSAVRVKEARTRHVNVVDGRRVTWVPPDCGGCRRVRVWVYGGSTTFGLGQRDGHTIPSELARVAAADGVVLDVQNRGVGGDTHWEAAQRFAWDLTVEEPPDMVVFYDGTNEFLASRFDDRVDAAPSVIPAEFFEQYRERVSADDRPPPTGGAWPDEAGEAPGSADEVGRIVAQRYQRSRWLSRTMVDSSGVVGAWIWQPTADQRPQVDGEPVDPGRDWARGRSRGASQELDADVIDLSTALADVRTPLFYDGIHTNELGARLIAEQVYARLAPELRRLADKGPVPPTGGGR